MFCSKCGAQLPDGAAFCGSCGNPTGANAQQPKQASGNALNGMPPILGNLLKRVIGFFTGKMLLERTVKVFKGWNFLRFGILFTLLALLFPWQIMGLYTDESETIAAAVGYENVKFFNQVFKPIIKLTPREFRRLHRELPV